MTKRQTGWRRIVLRGTVVCALLTGCAGSSGIQTPIHEGPDSHVFLEWVPQESFRASHPVTLQPSVLRRALAGVLIKYQRGLLAMLSGQEEKPERVFSNEDVDLLLPHLLLAFSRATPEERVVFQRIYPSDSGSSTTEGALYMHEDLLHLTLIRYGLPPVRRDITYVDDRHVARQTGLRNRALLFVPETALRPQTAALPGAIPDAGTLVIDFRSLGALKDTGVPGEGPGAGSPGSTPDATSLRALEEKVKQRELELERLKKELHQHQRDRGDRPTPRASE